MTQFGSGKAPPPWQQRPQVSQLQTTLLGHPAAAVAAAAAAAAGAIPSQQLMISAAPQQPQYTPVQQTLLQPPGLSGLQPMGQPSIVQPTLSQASLVQQSIAQSAIVQQSNMIQPTLAQPTISQATVAGNIINSCTTSLMQPPLTTQALQPPNIITSQLTNSSIQLQNQGSGVSYPAPRGLAPPGPFVSCLNQVGGNNAAVNIPSNNSTGQPNQKQRTFTGIVTKLCSDFGFVDEDVFFQTSCVKGPLPRAGDRVFVEATYNPSMPFKWNAKKVQVIVSSTAQSLGNSRLCSQREAVRSNIYNAVPPPSFNEQASFGNRAGVSSRSRSPRRERREEVRRIVPRDKDRDRDDKEKDLKRDTRKRSRSHSRDHTRSPPRRKQRLTSRYNVQIPRILLHMKEANVMELKKRYSNLYVPSDVFLTKPLWPDTFPAHRAFQFPRPVSFHIMSKDVDTFTENDAIYDPPDANHSYSAKVMLMSVPQVEEMFRRSCPLGENAGESRDGYVHPTRLINFLVGLKAKNETMAIGGYWSPSLDGHNPEKDANVLIRTAVRTCKALTGIDLSGCTTWYRFADIFYLRGESTHKGRTIPAHVETTVLFLPDVWNVCPTKLEWDNLQLNYKKYLEKKLTNLLGEASPSLQSQGLPEEEAEDESEDKEEEDAQEPTHWCELDPKAMKVVELKRELEARKLNSKGLKSQLIARLTKALKMEQDKETEKLSEEVKTETDEAKKKEEDEEKKREEEKKRKEEEESKREEEERKKAEEKERTLLEKRYTLPDQPMVIVHPSRLAKSGKFDCTTMSLSVLLDYRQEDNKEHSFEVSLFAELFNEMLMRDAVFRIFRALAEAPEKNEEPKKEDKKKEKKEEKDNKKEEDKVLEEKGKKDDRDEGRKEEQEEEEEEETVEQEEEVKENRKELDTNKEKNEKEKKKDDKKEKKKEKKKKMITHNPLLLLSFVYFDQCHAGYIIDKDMEDILNMLGLNLSRAQVKKLISKVTTRDAIYYRKLTDLAVDEKVGLPSLPTDLEALAQGNNIYMPVFADQFCRSSEEKLTQNGNEDKEEPVITTTGVVSYEGSLVDISKLQLQLERSENARRDTEEKLKQLQKELASCKDDLKKSVEKNNKFSKDVKSYQSSIRGMEEEMKKATEDNSVYQKALSQIKCVIWPLVDNDDEEELNVKIKSEVKESKK